MSCSNTDAHEHASLCCPLCVEHAAHPLYCYLMIDSRTCCKTTCNYIGVSRLPLLRMRSHNREPGFKCGAKSTRRAAGHWVMLLVIGPFRQGGAREFKHTWSKRSRGMLSRFKQGCAMAAADETLKIYASPLKQHA